MTHCRNKNYTNNSNNTNNTNNTNNKNNKNIRFPKLGCRRIEADFKGGRLTSNAGAFLLRTVNQQTGLIEALNKYLIDPREPTKIQHTQLEMLAQRITAIALGDEDLNDHQTLRFDPALQVAAEKVEPTTDHPLASPSTLCRFENRATHAACVRMNKVFVEQFINFERTGMKQQNFHEIQYGAGTRDKNGASLSRQNIFPRDTTFVMSLPILRMINHSRFMIKYIASAVRWKIVSRNNRSDSSPIAPVVP